MRAAPSAWLDEFLLAAGFLTRVPLPMPAGDAGLAEAAWAFPVVGLLVGLIGGLVFALAAALSLPVLAAALLAVAATVLTTGGLHEDGLADTADGFGGGSGREAKLAIMRDSRDGTYGVLALIFGVGLRAAALAAIAAPGPVLGALAAAAALGRGGLPAALRLLPAARSDGLGAEAGRPSFEAMLAAGGIALVVAAFGLGLGAGLAAALAAGLAMAALGWLAQCQIGGQTGDVLGAMEQVGEIVVLLVAASWRA